MSKLWSTALLVMGINLVLTFMIFSGPGLALAIVAFFAELIIGIVMAISTENRQQGQGILVGLGLSILIGASVCGIILMNLSIGH